MLCRQETRSGDQATGYLLSGIRKYHKLPGGFLFNRLLVPTISYLLDFSPRTEASCGPQEFYDPLYRRCYSLGQSTHITNRQE